MEFEVFDFVKAEKEKAIARFNLFRRVAKLWQFFQVLVLLGLFSWSSGTVAAAVKAVAGSFVNLTKFLLNHHVVFLIGNAIVFLLFLLFRRGDGGCGNDDDSVDDVVYRDYVKHSQAGHYKKTGELRENLIPPENMRHYKNTGESRGDLIPPVDMIFRENFDEISREIFTPETEERSIVCTAEEVAESTQCDEVAAAIEKAARQIKRFERTQLEKLKREIAVRPQQPELRRSETESRRRREVSGEASEIERLSSEEFQRTIEAFIDKHWSKKEMKVNKFGKI